MVFTDVGKEMVAYLMAFGSGTSYPRYCAIGSGSGAVAATDTALVGESGARNDYTSLNSGTAKQLLWTHDFSSTSISGITLTEFGLFDNISGTTGSMWQREGFPGIEFDGSNELQIQITFEVV